MWFDFPVEWTVRACGGHEHLPPDLAERLIEGVPATVPGTVHTDLLAAGLIPDPYLDRNELDLAWIGEVDWCYEVTFDRPREAAVTELVFDGLDTVAEIAVNGEPLAATENMHRRYHVRVPGLRERDNELVVTFRSALVHARAQREALGNLPNVGNDEPSHYIRKMACNFGWDWGPKLVTAGIWRRAGLRAWDIARLDGTRAEVALDGQAGIVSVRTSVAKADDTALQLRVRVGGVEEVSTVAGDATGFALSVRVPEPELWWPASLGKQPLYALEVSLETEAGAVVDHWHRDVGFRSVELDTASDAVGSRFTLVVNGTPLFVRGANWIPDDCFPHRVDAERYRRRITQAREANIDLLRVWGGGIYESDDFYAACDRLGVLVWQDFLFACAAYPEAEPLRSEVAAEARDNIDRLSAHPSLALWCGNNENYLGWFHWGWREELADRDWGGHYYEELLPALVRKLDPSRPYVPGSPWSNSPDRDVLDPDHGSMHIWDVWNERDYAGYRDHVPRFASEFGWQAPPTWATLTESVHDDPLAPDSPGVLHHQKAEDGNGKLARGLEGHFPKPTTIDDWHYLTQINQARAIRTGVEHLRSHRPRCMGSIVWQLNDCWPVTSWAAVDGRERRKPLWYALRESYADRLLTIQPRDGGLSVVAVNDGATDWRQTLQVRLVSVEGNVLARTGSELSVAARTGVEHALDGVAVPADPAAEFLVAELGDHRAFWFFVPDQDFHYPRPEWDASVVKTADGYEVHVTARALLRDLALFPDRLAPDAVVDDCLRTLLPGESTTFTIRTSVALDAGELTSAPVLRSIGDVCS